MKISRRRHWLIVTAVAILAGPVLAQDRDSLIRETWYWQDQRVGGNERLLALARAADAGVRRGALRALAHRSDSGIAEAIRSGLRDRSADVRAMAAFAAGQRWSSEEALFLMSMALRERDAMVRRGMFDAFGRIGLASALDSLTSAGRAYRGERRKDALTAMMRAAIRGLRLPNVIWYAFQSLEEPDPEVRWRALYVLGRSSPHPLLATEVAARREVLMRLSADRSPDVRIGIATMLARVDVPEAREILRRLADREFSRSDRDWRVLVQVVRSAASHARSDPAMGSILARGLQDENDHVVIATAMALPAEGPAMRALEDRDSLRTVLWSLIPSGADRAPLVTGEAMVALARFSPSDVDELLDLIHRRPSSARLRAKALEAFSMAPTAAGWQEISSAFQDSTPSVAMAGWDHARRFLRHPGSGSIVPDLLSRQELSEYVLDQAEMALQRRDMGISTVVATLLGDSSVIALIDSGGIRTRAVEALSNALSLMKSPDDVEAMQAAIQSLGSLGGDEAIRAVESMLTCDDASVVDVAVAVLRSAGRTEIAVPPKATGPAHTDHDWRLLRGLGSKPGAEFITERGTVFVELHPDEAPFTVLSFVRLARSGFFNGLTFHRVVPNFVVQGGDPRGDGWGGPGYAIRTEVTARSYERGSVGMASAGRDTEGSQFFFTHLPTPHLDARYTIFASVRRGMEIVDRWQVGDVIREVRILPTAQRGVRSR